MSRSGPSNPACGEVSSYSATASASWDRIVNDAIASESTQSESRMLIEMNSEDAESGGSGQIT
jgi:hypothetical protein